MFNGGNNMANYVNFDGNANKKIVQAPGGSSSFSLAWSNDKTDYGPPRNSEKATRKDKYPPMPEKQHYPPMPEKKVDISSPPVMNYNQMSPNYGNNSYENPQRQNYQQYREP